MKRYPKSVSNFLFSGFRIIALKLHAPVSEFVGFGSLSARVGPFFESAGPSDLFLPSVLFRSRPLPEPIFTKRPNPLQEGYQVKENVGSASENGPVRTDFNSSVRLMSSYNVGK